MKYILFIVTILAAANGLVAGQKSAKQTSGRRKKANENCRPPRQRYLSELEFTIGNWLG
jgi:hypothetical protein